MASTGGFPKVALLVIFTVAVALFVIGVLVGGNTGRGLTSAGFGLGACTTLFVCVHRNRK